jgi:hypothetical protein
MHRCPLRGCIGPHAGRFRPRGISAPPLQFFSVLFITPVIILACAVPRMRVVTPSECAQRPRLAPSCCASRRRRQAAAQPCCASSSTGPNVSVAAAAARGADFIRPHLRTMAPYTPIVPFDVLSQQLGRAPRDIIKLDANENPYGPPPGASARAATRQPQRCLGSGPHVALPTS